jgi:hypothetical protein
MTTIEARPIAHHFSQTSRGNDQVVVTLETDDGKDHVWNGYFTDGAIERTVESLRHMGYDGGDLADMKLTERVELVIEPEEYKGKVRDRVKWVNKIGSGPKPVSNMRALSMRVQDVAKRKDPVQNDDLPF